MSDPRWLTAARAKVGIRETAGPKSTAAIMAWAKRVGKRLGILYDGDHVPWCGLFVATCLIESGIEPPPIAVRALAWGPWGVLLTRPAPGAVLVFTRAGGGHVGFYVGEDASAYHVLGGNQADSVNVTRIAKNRLAAIRWPAGEPLPTRAPVVLGANGQRLSENEA